MRSHESSMFAASVQHPIVVATDFSSAANIAVEGAAMLSRHQNAHLHVLHVFDDGLLATLRHVYDARQWSGDDPLLGTRRRLSDLTAEVAQRHGIQAMAESESGDPAEAIARFAGQCDARLVVIGKESDDWLSDTLFGETAFELLEMTEVPVMIARRLHKQHARRVLIATDFSECARRAARFACQLFPDAEITLFNAYSVEYESRMRIGGASEEDIASYLLTEQIRAETAMRLLSSELNLQKPCRTMTINGHAVTKVLEEAANGFDVIVVGKNGDDAGGSRLGGITRDILYRADCDVLLVP